MLFKIISYIQIQLSLTSDLHLFPYIFHYFVLSFLQQINFVKIQKIYFHKSIQQNPKNSIEKTRRQNKKLIKCRQILTNDINDIIFYIPLQLILKEMQNNNYKAPIQTIFVVIGVTFLIYALPFFIIYCVYWQIWWVLGLLGCISILQLFITKRNDRYVAFLNKYFKLGYYMDISRIYEEQIQKQERTLFCFHPHGVFGYGIILNTNHIKYPNQKLTNAHIIGSNFALMVPLLGLHLRLWGIKGADAPTFKSLMENSKDISMLPGGYEQATLTTPKQLRVYLKQRKGFIKYALRYGYTIRQVLVMNQHKAMSTFDKFLNLRLNFNKIKIPGVFPISRYGPFLPPNIKATTIIGPALTPNRQLPQNQPTSQQINSVHKKYMEQLVKFYDRHKEKNQNVELKIY